MIAVLWRFRPKDDSVEPFEEAYGPGGAWARLFRTADGFLGTELLRSADGSYVTIDRWRTEAALERFLERCTREYDLLESACEALTSEETPIGRFESIAGEDEA